MGNPGGWGGRDDGAAEGVNSVDSIGVITGTKLPGMVFCGCETIDSLSPLGVECGNSAPDSLTFLIASKVCLYAWMSARHAPDIDRIVERIKMAND